MSTSGPTGADGFAPTIAERIPTPLHDDDSTEFECFDTPSYQAKVPPCPPKVGVSVHQ